jgi:CSLREA domain-containing protein
LVVSALVTALLAHGSPALAATLVVTKTADTNDGICNRDCSLREAINDANTGPATERIVVPSGTYALSHADGDLNITLDMVIEGRPRAVITPLTGHVQRIFDISGGAKVTMRDLEVTGGSLPNTGMFLDNGGGIRNAGDLTLERVHVHHNTADDAGGGIYSTGGSVGASDGLVLRDSIVDGNTAGTTGGGVQSAFLTADDSTISDNVAASGGGIFNNGGEATVRTSTVHGNSASSGGGVYVNSALLTRIEDSVLSGNEAPGGGGAINNPTGGEIRVLRSTLSSNSGISGGAIAISAGPTTITASTISGNGAAYGGGLFANGGQYTIDDTTISGNTAHAGGGGLRLQGTASASVTESTVTTNIADFDISNGAGDDGGGVQVTGAATVTITSSIIGGNFDDGVTVPAPDCNGPVTTGGSNVIGDTTGCAIVLATSDTEAPPQLDSLNNNGGPTETHALAPTSPALDHNAGSCGATDQRGIVRPVGAACDSGAYERVLCGLAVVNVIGTPGSDVLSGTNGDDGVLAFDGNDRVDGLGGDDTVCGGNGNDVLHGGDGTDALFGDAGRDTLFGDAGPDALNGGSGRRDRCFGGSEPDSFIGCERRRQ